MIDLNPKSNIANKVRNTKLPRTRPLMPIFELISNSIHAINELVRNGNLKKDPKIKIKLIRNGDEELLKTLTDIDKYPIYSVIVTDNGIGLNDENLNSFIETDTDHKIQLGGRGVGRFVCLKAFNKLIVKSWHQSNGSIKRREFEFRPTKEGFHDFNETIDSSKKYTGTEMLLSGFKDEYQKNAPSDIMEISRAIVTHFQLYFIQESAPTIIVENQNKTEVNLNSLFKNEFEKDIDQMDFQIGEYNFTIFLSNLNYS